MTVRLGASAAPRPAPVASTPPRRIVRCLHYAMVTAAAGLLTASCAGPGAVRAVEPTITRITDAPACRTQSDRVPRAFGWSGSQPWCAIGSGTSSSSIVFVDPQGDAAKVLEAPVTAASVLAVAESSGRVVVATESGYLRFTAGSAGDLTPWPEPARDVTVLEGGIAVTLGTGRVIVVAAFGAQCEPSNSVLDAELYPGGMLILARSDWNAVEAYRLRRDGTCEGFWTAAVDGLHAARWSQGRACVRAEDGAWCEEPGSGRRAAAQGLDLAELGVGEGSTLAGWSTEASVLVTTATRAVAVSGLRSVVRVAAPRRWSVFATETAVSAWSDSWPGEVRTALIPAGCDAPIGVDAEAAWFVCDRETAAVVRAASWSVSHQGGAK